MYRVDWTVTYNLKILNWSPMHNDIKIKLAFSHFGFYINVTADMVSHCHHSTYVIDIYHPRNGTHVNKKKESITTVQEETSCFQIRKISCCHL